MYSARRNNPAETDCLRSCNLLTRNFQEFRLQIGKINNPLGYFVSHLQSHHRTIHIGLHFVFLGNEHTVLMAGDVAIEDTKFYFVWFWFLVSLTDSLRYKLQWEIAIRPNPVEMPLENAVFNLVLNRPRQLKRLWLCFVSKYSRYFLLQSTASNLLFEFFTHYAWPLCKR